MNAATAALEQPVFFPGGGEHLFGIHTRPVGARNGVGVVIIQGGDTINVSLLRNRMAVRLARTLAGLGYDTLRFDYHGLGESSGEIDSLDLSDPLEGDAVAAAAHLLSIGAQHIVLVGSCFGARTALAAAARIPEVAGVVMAAPPVAGYDRDDAVGEIMAREETFSFYVRRAARAETFRGLFSPGRRQLYYRIARSKIRSIVNRPRRDGTNPLQWVSRMFLDQLENLATRGVPTLFVFGANESLWRDFERAREGRLGEILRGAEPVVEVIADLPDEVHGFLWVSVQDAFLDLAVSWIHRVAPAAARHP